MKQTILFVDNQPEAREKWGKLLKGWGYRVRLASTVQEARAELGSGRIDLAIIDMRLEHEELDTDISGLKLAAEDAFRHIPKIILTAYKIVDYEEQRKLWRFIGEKPPAVIAFVGKEEGPQALQDEIRYTFEKWPHFTRLYSRVSEPINEDHRIIRSQARLNYTISLLASLSGFLIIVVGIALAYAGKLEAEKGVLGLVTGLMLEAVGYLFFRQLDRASNRMDLYHQELRQIYGVEFLLSIAKMLPADRETACVERVINAVTDSWYPLTAKAEPRSDQKRSETSSKKE